MAITFTLTFSGDQEVPPNASAASGAGTVSWDHATSTATYGFTVAGVDFGPVLGMEAQTETTADDVTIMHVHNAPRGANGPVVFGQIGTAQDADDLAIALNCDGSWTVSGAWEATDPANAPIAGFAEALSAATGGSDVPLYFNVHTTTFPGGESRAQWVAEPMPTPEDDGGGEADADGDPIAAPDAGEQPSAKGFTLLFTGDQEVPPNGSAASGAGTVSWDSAARAAAYEFTVSGVDFGPVLGMEAQTETTDDDVTIMHVHNQSRGFNGPVVFGQIGPAQDGDDLSIVLNCDGSWTVRGVWETTDPANASIEGFAETLDLAFAGLEVPLYFNVHTTTFPGGEIRAQWAAEPDNVDMDVASDAAPAKCEATDTWGYI